MKQINLILACCLCVNSFLFAQGFPDYGNISSEEINLKECSFDKGANAVILLHEAYSNYDNDYRLVTTHHVRIKILKEKGISSADVSILFYRKNDFEQIDKIEGMTINIGSNGEIEKTMLDRKTIFPSKIDERIGKVAFPFPAVKVGSIIEYKYRSIMKNYGGLDDWSFQDELPVLISKYTVILLPNTEFAYRVNKKSDIPIVIRQETKKGGVYFEMSNIPGLGDEPYMDARRDYLQKVIFQLSGYGNSRDDDGKKNYMTSWDEVTAELIKSEDFGSQLENNIPGTNDFIMKTKVTILPEERMKTVFNYVRNNMTWNEIYSKYSSQGVKDAWRKKTGTSGDINLVLVNLLKEADLEAYPMLVSERFHGKVNIDYPFIDQFNSVFACVIINDKKYYLDATDKSVPPHLIPFNILNTTAFVVNKTGGGLINITNDTLQYKEDIWANLLLTGDGTLSGDISVKSYDYARIIKLDDYKNGKDKFINKYFSVAGTTLAITDLQITNTENDSLALNQNSKLKGSLNKTGEYSFLPLNLFTGFDTNPFLSDNRFSNINFGYKRTINLNINVQLPADFTVDGLPKSARLTNPDGDIVFIRQLEHDKTNNSVHCSMTFQFKKSLYETGRYPMIKEIYKRLFDYLQEPMILKKK